ncbi:pre-mRNA-splicing factor CWC25 homolog [Salvelinus sp. IW2-2015]|uniref:pre-mRNA-splicing factor CWC25 homolog n=1 Tax=Salvelinus sp. IW2-2015 TaxID=2691554 RepID=UPI000CDFB3B9|nr:pre-mRNA-splicing factor CWC25 homolog [Salvelinus alpinus]
MGGGDLNLKKSWHPQTMKNIERVWKAEQKHEAEAKKIEELQKELKEERAREDITRFAQQTGALKKKDDRLDWMYQGPGGQVSRDEYLLGRPIDKQITQQFEEPESGPSEQTGLLPGSIFKPSTPASNLDMAAKIREDPLFDIKKREEEKRREVLTNPVKMKKIKEMLRQNLEKKDKKKKRKKDKKEKREEKERRKEKKHKRRSLSSSSEDENKKHRHHSKEESKETTHSHSHHRNVPAGYGLQFPAGRHHQSSKPPNHSRHRSQERSCSRSPQRTDGNGHHSSHRTDNHSSHKSENHSSHRTDQFKVPQFQRPKAPSPQKDRYQRRQSSTTKCLSADELEKKRREMMDFAKQRDKEREINVRSYKRRDEQEKEREKEKGGKHDRNAGFIHNMKLESASTSSLEDRVKRNINSIQRTPASLEKNFMRR